MAIRTHPEITVAAARAQVIADVAGQSKAIGTVTISALTTNSNPVYIGDNTVTTGNGLPMPAGSERTIPSATANELYCIGTAGDKLRIASLRY